LNIIARKREYAKKYYNGRCYVCERPFGKGFSFHHLWYDGGEPNRDTHKKDYFEYVFKQIERNPSQFYLLCQAHHYFVEWRKSIKNILLWKRFLKVCKESINNKDRLKKI
jgi:hypothetical protein